MSSETGREITYLEAVREALAQEMRRDERVFLIGEDLGVYGGAFGVTWGLQAEFGPERVRDTPISEAAIAGAATGAALMGMRPVMEIMFMDFITISMNQLVNQAAKMRFMFGGKASLPMVIRAPAGSGTGAAAQHCQSLEAWFINVVEGVGGHASDLLSGGRRIESRARKRTINPLPGHPGLPRPGPGGFREPRAGGGMLPTP